MIQVYTGNGKGKTTSSLGLIIRALGHNWRVCLIQFMKNDWSYGEIKTLSKLQGLDIFQFGTKDFVNPKNPAAIDFQEAESGWAKAKEILISDKYQLVVLDEINVAVFMKLLSVEKQLELCDLAGKAELVMTGRYADEQVIARADLVTEMREQKHYFNQGVASRKGIEF
ncbi:MAG: cob(I)yrinic acid a,c-diamide adenosyltransferase [Candidatus Stygibacter australis]|nr:cob(I)yrinic acid a,c-diamide adenosyltransferase [Candidatus Stygibacter australis]MDP8323067.1 cob(I)yrinic acid a,c-diamide adenosyltransferase [Candidatus Stygibacter australis]